MTTTCQQIVDRAKGASVLNKALVTDRTEMLAKIRELQAETFTATNAVTRDFFQVEEVVLSSVASAKRSVDLSATLTRPLSRIVRVAFDNSGEELAQVDQLDLEAEYAPRFTMQQYTLTEVGSDWGLTGVGIALNIVYSFGPTDIDVAAGLDQNTSLPDDWTDLLVLPLAQYLVLKDYGRDVTEYTRLDALAKEKMEKWIEFVRQYAGVEVRRFMLPVPAQSGKR